MRHPAWVVALILLALVLGRMVLEPPRQPAPEWLNEGTYVVQRVVDGDTLVLANAARIRLIGVDTPESVHPTKPLEPLGTEAADFTRQAVEGKTVRLQFDREHQDRYGRFLAYVFVDGRMLNEEIIRVGLSPAETSFRYDSAMKRRFRKAEDEAHQWRRGLHATEPSDGPCRLGAQ